MILLATAVPFFFGTDTGTCALEFFPHGTRGVTNSNSMVSLKAQPRSNEGSLGRSLSNSSKEPVDAPSPCEPMAQNTEWDRK
ncbi:hypothetical protein H634G_02790 [Metarhizium anisopliae BRIP 53293]|uniref:Uncharacterized protein n=1 Tax=Metarhizium anisopliae BRIP 53293 TaxID=1291518 RepID=A0A0D9P9S3_METAN|nr:hypothetical protein H634G_02790 [Metarhizium anisopliae BRIP 53293]KJK85481.1 hypothetical protein H633G_10676 [Metarhizium anisopliae BRIP 53284]